MQEKPWKSTNIDLEKRCGVIAELLIKGYARSQIIKITNDPKKGYNWDVSTRQIDTYIARAKEMIQEDAQGDKKDYFNLAVMRYNDLYKKNYDLEEYKECRGVQDSFNKLVGIAESEKTEMTIKSGALTKEDRELLIESLNENG